ncbi:putative CorA-like Mg2+ transporter protein [Nitrosotalea sinensis]|uniref:Putative CorA-like Mg2+ transporter protein n=1 Tax=Nitrosotalea sinensis TaxID=1499975 RepID=A0A2H1EI06_9ARCH|nr:CorA family divalent cation transporter [Candidatus Nitrosotalea sinensis]SHO46183.1 putative CorA-like Mg2+ transporter protein [Candidatus Nitrosotalea sinensis]
MIKAISVAGMQEGVPFKKPAVELDELPAITSSGHLTWIECVVDNIIEETPKILNKLSISMDPSVLLSGYVSSYEDRGDMLGLMIPFVVPGNNTTLTAPILIFMKKDLIVTIHDDYGGKIARLYNYAPTVLRKLPKEADSWADRQTILLARIIDEISEANFSILRLIVERAEQFEIDLAGSRQVTRDISLELSSMKTSLLTFLNAIWASYDTVHNLKYGDADLVSDDEVILAKFEVILGRLDRQIQMSENVMQMVATGANVVQTEVTNKVTILIIWWTVAGTAELVPNTIATVFGLYPNHETVFWPIVATVVGSAAVATAVAYFYVRKFFGKSLGLDKLKKFKRKFAK